MYVQNCKLASEIVAEMVNLSDSLTMSGSEDRFSHNGAHKLICMGESFQDHSWIQDFEADFP